MQSSTRDLLTTPYLQISFLDEDEVIETVVKEVAMTLTNANTSRTFSVQVCYFAFFVVCLINLLMYLQTLLPGASNAPGKASTSKGKPFDGILKGIACVNRYHAAFCRVASGSTTASYKPAPQHKVRMDPKDRTLESMNMFGKRDPTQLLNASSKRAKIDTTVDSDEIDVDNRDDTSDIEMIEQEGGDDRIGEGPLVEASMTIEESEVNLKSVKKLRLLAERGGHLGTTTGAFSDTA